MKNITISMTAVIVEMYIYYYFTTMNTHNHMYVLIISGIYCQYYIIKSTDYWVNNNLLKE